MATAVRRHNLYVLKQLNAAYISSEHPKNCIHEWHKICGHRDIEVIKKLNPALVNGGPIVNCAIKETCGVCLAGKKRGIDSRK